MISNTCQQQTCKTVHCYSQQIFQDVMVDHFGYFTNNLWPSSNQIIIPILIHFLGSMSPSWAHSGKRGSGWSWCLLATCLIIDFHFAMIRFSKPCLVELAINMVSNTFHPLLYYSTSRLLACFKHFLANRTGNMPNVIEVFGLWSAFSDPPSDTSVAVWNEYWNSNSSCKQEVETPLCSLQFHVGRTATCLIGL